MNKENLIAECDECGGICCLFTIIKTRNLDTIIRKRGGIYIIETELVVVDPNYFKYHKILMLNNKRRKTTVFMFATKKEIKRKIINFDDGTSEKWFNIPIPCKHLINGKCSIYNKRPESCKIDGCPFQIDTNLFFNWDY